MKRLILILTAILLFCCATTVVGDDELIRQGSKGEAVVRIQMRLFDLGYYTYKPTGSFQTVTRSAVVSYQVASGIMSDGTIGPESMNALFSRSAKRVDFHAEIPLTFTAQGEITQKGKAIPWSALKNTMIPEKAYRFRNASTGEELRLVYQGGEGHAEMTVPATYPDKQQTEAMLVKWLGSTDSFYKCAVLMELDGQWIAASMQWDGESRACVYFTGSVSNVCGLSDTEHAANIRKATN